MSENAIESITTAEAVRAIGEKMVADGKRLQSRRLTIGELVRIAHSYGLRLSVEVVAVEPADRER